MGGGESRLTVQVWLLGRFGISIDGVPADLPPGQLRVLLAVLAMSAGRPVSIERLAEAMWGENLPANARRTVQTYITRLRGALGAETIATSPSGYLLQTGPESVDALRFGRLVDRAAQEPEVERELLLEALGCWHGRPFEGLESRWLVEHEASRLEELRLTAVERRIDLDLAAGRAADVIGEVRDLARQHPLRESLWVRLLSALAGSGRSAEALEQYEVIRTRIAEELGVDPGAELRQIHASLLAGDPPSFTVIDPAVVSEPTVPRQLPADISRFTGRARLLARLDTLLAEGRAGDRMVIAAVHGSGGMGKTTLAVHWAHRVAPAFPDGQLYLNLRGFGPDQPMTPAAALDSLLRGIGVPGDQIPAETEARANLLRSGLADRQLLMILDNARDVEQVRSLLPGTGDTFAIVTSRSQLRGLVAREGAHRVSVDELDASESSALLTATLDAQQVTHGAAALAELADRCGHLPLALAIAAERAGREPETGLTDLVVELREERERLDAFEVGDLSADVRAVFTWSYQALDDETAAMFRVLGSHPGPDLSLPAAAALAGSSVPVARRLLDRLVDGHLLQQRRPGRYELHDLLRTYAVELTERHDSTAERDAALERILDWYLHSAGNARMTLKLLKPVPLAPVGSGVTPLEFGSREHAVAWFDGERQVLAAAAQSAARSGSHRMAYQVARVLWSYLYDLRAIDDLLELLRLGLESTRETGDRAAEADLTNLLGRASEARMDYEIARDHFERALELFEQVGDAAGMARAISNLGIISRNLGRLEDAAAHYERALAIEQDVGDLGERAVTLNNLAMTYLDMGRYEEAAEISAEAEQVGRRLGPRGILRASALDTLGQALLNLGQPEAAVERFEQAQASLQEAGAGWEEGIVLTNLGRALHSVGRPDEARAAWEHALAILDELGAPDSTEFSRVALGELLSSLSASPG